MSRILRSLYLCDSIHMLIWKFGFWYTFFLSWTTLFVLSESILRSSGIFLYTSEIIQSNPPCLYCWLIYRFLVAQQPNSFSFFTLLRFCQLPIKLRSLQFVACLDACSAKLTRMLKPIPEPYQTYSEASTMNHLSSFLMWVLINGILAICPITMFCMIINLVPLSLRVDLCLARFPHFLIEFLLRIFFCSWF